jgi:hypothetical protein
MPKTPNLNTMWTIIPDAKVRHVWSNEDGSREITVPPDYYGENGTPVDGETGDDMIYVRTEVQI